jgi:hypothetical protein
MRMRGLIMAGLVLYCASIVGAYQDDSLSFSRPSIEAVPLKEAPKWHVKVFEDEDFTFFYRHYGREKYQPGFFIYGKRLRKWIEIKKLTTENAKLGRSPSIDEVRLSVSWDHSSLRGKDYAELPLKTSGSISFPSKIRYDADAEVYMLEFDTELKKEEYLTRFWVDREDLEEALKRRL